MANLKDVLQDLVNYAVTLNLDTIRVTGTDKSVVLESVREDKKIIMKAKTKTVMKELQGTFGMPNLKILKGYVETFGRLEPAADESATTKASKLKIEVQYNNKDTTVPTDIEFSLPGSATALYRLKKDHLPPQPTLNSPSWDVEVKQPARAKIQEFSSFAAILADLEKNFSVRTDGENLKFFIGDENSANSKVNFTFASGIKAKIDPKLYWQCNDFLSIMNLAANANTVVKITNKGIIQIDVDSGLIDYEFILPGSNR